MPLFAPNHHDFHRLLFAIHGTKSTRSDRINNIGFGPFCRGYDPRGVSGRMDGVRQKIFVEAHEERKKPEEKWRETRHESSNPFFKNLLLFIREVGIVPK